jgi:hypothetical protein
MLKKSKWRVEMMRLKTLFMRVLKIPTKTTSSERGQDSKRSGFHRVLQAQSCMSWQWHGFLRS